MKVSYTYKKSSVHKHGACEALTKTFGEQNGHYHRKHLCAGNP